MPYVHISHIPGQGRAAYQAVADLVGSEPPEGQLLSIAGEADGGLHLVDVWVSKEDADRFAADRLFPAFHRTGVSPGGDASYVTFETDDIDIAADAAKARR